MKTKQPFLGITLGNALLKSGTDIIFTCFTSPHGSNVNVGGAFWPFEGIKLSNNFLFKTAFDLIDDLSNHVFLHYCWQNSCFCPSHFNDKWLESILTLRARSMQCIYALLFPYIPTLVSSIFYHSCFLFVHFLSNYYKSAVLSLSKHWRKKVYPSILSVHFPGAHQSRLIAEWSHIKPKGFNYSRLSLSLIFIFVQFYYSSFSSYVWWYIAPWRMQITCLQVPFSCIGLIEGSPSVENVLSALPNRISNWGFSPPDQFMESMGELLKK